MTEKKKYAYLILGIIVLAVILQLKSQITLILTAPEKQSYRATCPYKVEGNSNAAFVIKYVDSPYCVWCWLELVQLKQVLSTKGNSFKLESYDIRYCDKEIGKYKFSGTPSFVFSVDNATKEYTHFGYLEAKHLDKIICEMTGDCE